jgi:hypothetical protein
MNFVYSAKPIKQRTVIIAAMCIFGGTANPPWGEYGAPLAEATA